jgi:hypothetical protein
MDNIEFQEQLISTIQYQVKMIQDMKVQLDCMDRKLNYMKQELDATRWNIQHVFGIVNEVKKVLIDKFNL